jgi:hypothetical protein
MQVKREVDINFLQEDTNLSKILFEDEPFRSDNKKSQSRFASVVSVKDNKAVAHVTTLKEKEKNQRYMSKSTMSLARNPV